MRIKRFVYIFLFTVLGILLSTLVHAAIEMPVLFLFEKDFNTFSLGLHWEAWYTIHGIGSIVLLLAGIAFGYWQGTYWWKVLYIDKKRGNMRI